MRNLSRKSFVNLLGVTGLGVGLMAGTIGAPSAMAQEEDPKDVLIQLLQDSGSDSALQDEELQTVLITLLQDEGGTVDLTGDAPLPDGAVTLIKGGEGEISISKPAMLAVDKAELYAEFTSALADELGIANADEVDAAIRIAMMSVIDARVDDGILTAGKAEALKFLIATSDVPLPAMGGFGPHPGGMFVAAHGPGFGPGEGRFKGAIRERIFAEKADAHNEDKKERAARADQEWKSSDSQPDEEKQG